MSAPNIAEFGPCDCTIWKNYRTGEVMPHWRSLVESKYLSHFELKGNDVTVTIKAVRLSEVIGSGGKKSKKALMTFEGKEKGAVMGVTCLSAIAGIYGDDTDGWVGKRITLYPTTTEASGKTVGTIRIRPTAPAAPRGRQAAPSAPAAPVASTPEREPGDDRGDEPSAEEMGS
jgi:hypothetical protein